MNPKAKEPSSPKRKRLRFADSLAREFAGKVALVLGGSSGIGLAAAELLARRGAVVAIIGHDRSVGSAAKQIASAGICVGGFQGDASKESFVRRAIRNIISKHGAIDILINSAGIHPMGDITETALATWDRTMAVNLRAMFLTCHLAVPAMIKRGSGAIINVASVQATACSKRVCAYGTTKGAILAFTRTLAVYLGPKGIRANAVSPGSIVTPMQEYFANVNRRHDQTVEDMYAQFAKPVPVGRLGDVAETAELICFLASGRAGFCNGGEYVADGGLISGLRLY
jgi:NAD(P)-dependent dehydrogenase (short-subunit alcohol dehydrogenase family)